MPLFFFMVQALVRGVQRDTNEDSSIAVNLQKCDGSLVSPLIYTPVIYVCSMGWCVVTL